MSVNNKRFRVALLGIYHESNTFIDTPTELKDFENGHWLKGEAIKTEYKNAFHEIGGMLQVLQEQEAEVIPVMFAEATPGGIISAAAFNTLTAQMLAALEQVLPVDACLVVPHGAAVSAAYADMDGQWLSRLREMTGPEIPIVGTLDPHANVSQLMVKSTDALIAYSTNPHIDQRETGKQAAGLLMEMLHKRCKPVQVLTQAPLAISIEQHNTSVEPCKGLYQAAATLKQQPGVLSVSILLGFPYADVTEMGTSFLVITDNNQQQARDIGAALNALILADKHLYVGKKKNLLSQFNEAHTSAKPVLLLDMGDNVGAGSPGNSTYLLAALEKDGRFKSFTCIFDPQAVAAAAQFQDGDQFSLSFGNNPEENKPYTSQVSLLSMQHGRFEEALPRHGGQVSFDMGKTAVVSTQQGNVVMLMSLRIPPFSLKQLTSFGIDPADFDVVVAKGVNAPIAAYGPACPTIMQMDTPGVTQADMTRFRYRNRRKPLFPFEELIAH